MKRKAHLIYKPLIINYQHSETGQQVMIPVSLIDSMTKHCRAHYPKEFGGILTGLDLGNLKIVMDVEVPSQFENSATRFTRHAVELNRYLAECYDKSGGRITYLGEWHSHPNGSNSYSANDAKSIIELAEENASRQPSPLLMILSIYPQKEQLAVFAYGQKQLKKLEIL